MPDRGRVVIAGGTGLIGRALATGFSAAGCDVVVLTRGGGGSSAGTAARSVAWDPDGTAGAWAQELDGAAAVINLAGAGLADRRWTKERKEELRASRVLPTRSLVAGLRSAPARPAVFVQGSAVGFYGISRGDDELDESFPPGDDFLGRLCVAWEAEAQPAAALGCRLVVLRTGVVVSPRGGVIERMRLPFLWLIGGPVASGRQFISWIHLDDFVAMVLWAVRTPAVSGVLNASSPKPVSNREFSAALARALHRPSWMPVPAFALRLLYGELAEALLVHGQRVVPKRAVDLGFAFGHPAIEEAMADVFRPSRA